MERFSDQPLGPNPHIAVLGSDKVGNFVVTTPLLRGLKEKYPDAIVDFFGGAITADLEASCPYVDARLTLYGGSDDLLDRLHGFVRSRGDAHGPYVLAINCDGFSAVTQMLVPLLQPRYAAGATLRSDLRRMLDFPPGDFRGRLLADDDWNGTGLVDRFAGEIGSNYIAELFCRIAFVETDYAAVEVHADPPPVDIPEVLVHMTTTAPTRMWLPEHWARVLRWCRDRGVSVGVIGTDPATERALYSGAFVDELVAETGARDLRGQFTIPQVAGAFRQARAAVVINSGPMHLAVASGCPTIVLHGCDSDGFGAGPVRLWGPRSANAIALPSAETCRVCSDARFRLPACTVDGQPCMRSLDPDAVIARLASIVRP